MRRRASSALSLLVSLPLVALFSVAAASAQPPAQQQRAPAGAAPAASEPVDAELESSLTGRSTRLSTLRSRVIVLFYEDRAHIPQNEELKGNLERFIADNHLETQLALQPIANADGYGSVASLVRAGLAEGSRRLGLDILIDWDRRLQAAPFSMQGAASNVVVIDRRGRIVWRHAGLVGPTERTALFRAIRHALRDAA
jgi:hypothetical protein